MTNETASTLPPAKKRASRWVIGLSCAYLLVLCVTSYLLYGISERWWVGAVLTFAPKTPFLVPVLMLLVASLFWSRESLVINLVSLAIVVVPLMGLSIPVDVWLNGSKPANAEVSITIVSCNVQAFRPDFDKVLDEITQIKPNVVALQEAFRGDPRLKSYFHDWHIVHHAHYWVASIYPMKLITDFDTQQFGGRPAGMMVEIETPAGPVVLADIHQMTARFGLMQLGKKSIVTGEGVQNLEDFQNERYMEALDLRQQVDGAREQRPMIVCGDFNTPASSSHFQKHWGDLQSAFDLAGFGYGYTSPCKGNRYWPDNTPWARIDHILCSSEWTVRSCEIGKSDGSDHRLITATLVLKAKNP